MADAWGRTSSLVEDTRTDTRLVQETARLVEKPPTPKAMKPKKPEAARNTREDANVHARMYTRLDAPPQELVETLYRNLEKKQHLSSYTFRFRFEELDVLRKLDEKLSKSHPRKMSKNDLVRLGVNWLLEDYERNGEKSVLTCILARM